MNRIISLIKEAGIVLFMSKEKNIYNEKIDSIRDYGDFP